jgi:parvulin-like peptidyl-prolyl cis-trans isomerase-like protein
MNRPFVAATVAAAFGCASSGVRDPGCANPADRAEIQQVQIGWTRLDPGLQRPVEDPNVARSRDPRQAEALAGDLLAQCRKGASMEGLQLRYSEVPGGSVVVGPQANVPFKAAALCLQKNECAVVRSNVAFHVLKRIG